MGKKVITEQQIMEAARRGQKTFEVGLDNIVTHAAADKARSMGIRLVRPEVPASLPSQKSPLSPTPTGTVAIGSDHGGYALKEDLKTYLQSIGVVAVDVGTNSTEACDYPDFAYAVAQMVASGKVNWGIMIDAVGSASAMVANKVSGIRAANCYNEFSARSAREHNDANVLTLGGRVLGTELAKAITKVWLETAFAGGRHQQRVQKILDVENRFPRRG